MAVMTVMTVMATMDNGNTKVVIVRPVMTVLSITVEVYIVKAEVTLMTVLASFKTTGCAGHECPPVCVVSLSSVILWCHSLVPLSYVVFLGGVEK